MLFEYKILALKKKKNYNNKTTLNKEVKGDVYLSLRPYF